MGLELFMLYTYQYLLILYFLFSIKSMSIVIDIMILVCLGEMKPNIFFFGYSKVNDMIH